MIPSLKTYIVFVSINFDALTVEHIRLLQYAKIYGISQSSFLRCKLVAATNSGRNKEILEALECVDEVCIYDKQTIQRLQPDCIVAGEDVAAVGDIPVILYREGKVKQ